MLSLPRQHLYILCMFEVHRSALTGLRRLDIWPNTNSLPNAFKLCGQVFLPAVQSACLSCIDCAWVVLFYAVVWSCSPRSTTVWLSSVAWLREAVQNPSRTWATNGRRFRRFKASGRSGPLGVPRGPEVIWFRYGKVTWDGPWRSMEPLRRTAKEESAEGADAEALEIAGVQQNDQLETVDPCRPMSTHVDPCWTYLMTWSDLKWLWYYDNLWYLIILYHTLWYTFIQEHNASLAQFYDVLHDLCSPNWHHAMGFSCQAEAAQPSPEKEPAPSLWPWPKAYFGNWYLPISPHAYPNAWHDTMSLILEKLSRRFTMLYDVILCYTMLYCISLRLGFCDPYHLDVAATVRHLKTSILKEFLDDVWHPGWSWTLWGCSAVVAREIYRWSAQPTTAGVELMMRHDAWWISLNLNFRNLNACLWSFMIHDVSSHSSLGLGQKLPQDIRFKHFQIFQTGV